MAKIVDVDEDTRDAITIVDHTTRLLATIAGANKETLQIAVDHIEDPSFVGFCDSQAEYAAIKSIADLMRAEIATDLNGNEKPAGA